MDETHVQSEIKTIRSGDDASASARGATSLELDWEILVLNTGVSGEEVGDGREGVHL